jgi:hypothetical protein
MALLYVYTYLHEGREVHFYASERRLADQQFKDAFNKTPLDDQFVRRDRW